MNTAPKRIYLDIGDQFALEAVASGAQRWDLLEGITWSEDNATSHGVPYVRADLVPTPAASRAATLDSHDEITLLFQKIKADGKDSFRDALEEIAAHDYFIEGFLAGRQEAAQPASPAPLTEVPWDGCLNDLGWKMNSFLTDNGAVFNGHVFNNMKGFLRDCITEWLVAHPAALASPQVAPAPTDDQMREALWFAMDMTNVIGRTRANLIEYFLHKVNKDRLAAPVQVAPHPEPAFWVRRHPDGVLTGEVLSDAQIEPVRRNSGGWLPLYVGSAPVAPQDDARDAADTRRMNWLETMTVNVRVPMRYGSRDLFWSSPDDEDGFVRPGDIRARIDAAMPRSTPAAKPTEPTLPTQGDAK